MTIVKLVAMAKDLGLDEHYALHQAGKTCGSAAHECATRTQVWRALFILELMIGGPQGKHACWVSQILRCRSGVLSVAQAGTI
jgi:hypothetical protein